MLARTQVKALNLKIVAMVNIMVGTLLKWMTWSPSQSVLYHGSMVMASSAVMRLMKM